MVTVPCGGGEGATLIHTSTQMPTLRMYLIAYDYGQGAVWAYIEAESAGQIIERFPDCKVFETPCMDDRTEA
jgi:hypothetical protein